MAKALLPTGLRQNLAVVRPLELVFSAELGEDQKRLPVRQAEGATDLGRQIENAKVQPSSSVANESSGGKRTSRLEEIESQKVGDY